MVMAEVAEGRTQVIGALVHGGVAHVHQGVALSVLDEDEFFERTGLRLSWPARVCLRRLLQEDVLLQDLRTLFLEGALSFDGTGFELAAKSAQIAPQRVERIARVVELVNPVLPEVLNEARELLRS